MEETRSPPPAGEGGREGRSQERRDQEDYQRRGAAVLIKDKLCRIKRPAVLHHVVREIDYRKAGAAYERDDIAALHALPLFTRDLARCPYTASNAIPVIQLHPYCPFGIKYHGDHTTRAGACTGGVRLAPISSPSCQAGFSVNGETLGPNPT